MNQKIAQKKKQNKHTHTRRHSNKIKVTSLGLVVSMGPRFIKTKKFMPAGLMASLGGLASVYNGYKSYEYWQTPELDDPNLYNTQ